MEIPFAIDDPEPKFENCEFPRFRTADGSMKFCWKEDPDEPLIPDGAPPTDD